MANKNRTKNVARALPGVILIMLVAGAVTYGGKLAVAEATKPKPAVVKTVTVTKAEDTTDAGAASGDNAAGSASGTTNSSSSTSSSATSSTPVAEPTTPTATTNSFVYLRPTASTSGSALEGLEAGTVVQYTTKSTTSWQKVTVNGKTGYIFTRWLTY